MLSLDALLHKNRELRDELQLLAKTEQVSNSETSVVGTIEYYEDFLAGYISRLISGKHLSNMDYESIQSYKPFVREGFLNAYQQLKRDFPRVNQHLQTLERIRDDVLANRPRI